MGEDLRADTAALRAGATRLVTASEVVRGLDAGSLTGRRSGYGHAGLADAASELSMRWVRGLREMTEEVAGRGRALVAVAEALEAADAAAAAAAGATGSTAVAQ